MLGLRFRAQCFRWRM